MVRPTQLPRPSLLMIRLGGVAAVTGATFGATTACGGTDQDGTRAVEIIPAAEYVAPAVVQEPEATPVRFVIPEGVTYATAESAFAAKRYSEATEMFTVIAERQ